MRRRGRVFQPRKGRGAPWAYRVDIAPPGSATRKQRTRGGFATKAEAQQALNDVLSRLSGGKLMAPSTDTLGEFVSKWIDGLERRGYKESTVIGYRNQARNHVLTKDIAAVRLKDLTPEHLNELYDNLLSSGRRDGKGGLSPRTVRYIHDLVSASMVEGVRTGRLPHNIAALASPPRTKSTKPPRVEPWSKAELAAFLNGAADHDLFPVWRVAAATGLRRGELCALRWSDVDLESNVIHVRRSRTVMGGKEIESTPKSDESIRSVSVDPATIEVLTDLRSVNSAHIDGDDTYVFVDPDGAPLKPGTITDTFTALIRDLGLRHLKFHGLRHTHATLLIEAGVNMKSVSERLGHASVAFTLEKYVHSLPDAGAAMARHVEVAVFAAPTVNEENAQQ